MITKKQIKDCKKYCKAFYDKRDSAYHNWKHIEQVLLELKMWRMFDLIKVNKDDYRMLKIAIMFHDIAQDKDQSDSDNVEASAGKFTEYMFYNFQDATGDELHKILELICVTDYSQELSYNHLERVMTDMDLSILKQNNAKYREYSSNIRKEYSQFSYGEYKVGRGNVLKKLIELAKENNLFYHIKSWNEKALINLTTELKELESEN